MDDGRKGAPVGIGMNLLFLCFFWHMWLCGLERSIASFVLSNTCRRNQPELFEWVDKSCFVIVL